MKTIYKAFTSPSAGGDRGPPRGVSGAPESVRPQVGAEYQGAARVVEIEDNRGHSFVAQFAHPLSSGEVALPGDRTKRVKAGSKELWYSARKFGADEAYKLALRHTASKAIDVSTILTLEEQCPDQAVERPAAFVLSVPA